MDRAFVRAWFAVSLCCSSYAAVGCGQIEPPPYCGSASQESCQSSSRPGIPSNERPLEPGTAVVLSLTPADQETVAQAQSLVAAQEGLTAEKLLRRRPVAFEPELGYDPGAAANLELIQASELSLDDGELAVLKRQGFAISKRHVFPNMAYGLRTIYAMDLPLYVSIDPILDAVHNSYDSMLKTIEEQVLFDALRSMLQAARSKVGNGMRADDKVAKDLDLYFGVALGLLDGRAPAPIAGADGAQLSQIVASAVAASGIQEVVLFGVKRDFDYSQFKPRGHYTDSPELGAYFRAMMWLGRTDFRLIETQKDGRQVFHRRQFDAMLGLREAMQGDAARGFEKVDAVVSAFVGAPDYMQLPEVDALLADLGAASLADAKRLSDQAIAQKIVEAGYGIQQIASQVIYKEASTAGQTFPLDRSFALLGQRYVVDSHVFSEVVYDRVLAKDGAQPRYLPDPLDAAYAALGNDAALPILKPDLEAHGYAPNLERMRLLIDEHDSAFWQGSLYNLWLASLRSLDYRGQVEGRPSVTDTEAWSKRVLNTQLGSWAQLRHDTILYAKQSYTSGIACEFPDAYVDPYPEAFERLAQLGARGKQMIDGLGDASTPTLQRAASYFGELEKVAKTLRDMAAQQLQGLPWTAEQMAFINDAVKSHAQGCGGPLVYEGWYSRLLFDASDEDMDPTIADVHTDPGGDRPARVLHVATGLPRLMVVTAKTCEGSGARAYAGLSFAYHEVVTDNLKRLDDEDWAGMAMSAADVPWMQSILH